METNFWIQRWETKNIAGFHQSEATPLLVKYFNKLSLAKGSRVFIPLCGKTLDIHWLLSKGYHVAGVELSKIAIEELFTELGVEPAITVVGQLQRYSAQNIDIFVGDIFNLSATILGTVNAIYDRAALVALPAEMRSRYATHLLDVTGKAPQLLICYEYDQNLMEGPPFSVSSLELNTLYGNNFNLTLLESADVTSGRLKGKVAAKENVWLLNSEGDS